MLLLANLVPSSTYTTNTSEQINKINRIRGNFDILGSLGCPHWVQINFLINGQDNILANIISKI